jgi:hypothetical protein
MSADKPTVTMNAEKLLSLLKATRPLAGTDKEYPHFMLLRFQADKTTLGVSATDGHTFGTVSVGLELCTEPVIWCIATEHVPLLEQLLSRLDAKERGDATVDLTIGRHKVQVTLQQSQIFVPKSEEQLEIPDHKRAIPEPYRPGQKTAGSWGLDPDLVARVMRCASRVANALEFTAPATVKSPMRIDIVENIAGYEGVFVVAPMNIDEEKERQRQAKE